MLRAGAPEPQEPHLGAHRPAPHPRPVRVLPPPPRVLLLSPPKQTTYQVQGRDLLEPEPLPQCLPPGTYLNHP